MELYASENNFNIFYEKKRRELKNLQQLNEFVKPAPYFVYFMFKDTIHVDDYGSIKETLFKFPSMTRVSSKTQFSFTTSTGQAQATFTIPDRMCLTKYSSFFCSLGGPEPGTSDLPVWRRCE